MDERQELIRFWLIKKLSRKGYWGRRPINFDDLRHPRLSRREIEDECKRMVKEGLMIMKPGLREMRYGLNSRNQEAVMKELERLSKRYGMVEF